MSVGNNIEGPQFVEGMDRGGMADFALNVLKGVVVIATFPVSVPYLFLRSRREGMSDDEAMEIMKMDPWE